MLKSITLSILLVGLAVSCPSPDLIAPCKCADNSIYCGSQQGPITQDKIESVLIKLDKALVGDAKHMKLFQLQGSDVKELSVNMFHGLTFERMEFLSNNNLTTVHISAFVDTAKTIKSILFQGNEHLNQGDLQSYQSLFYALGKLVNAEKIEILKGANITEIPGYAFPPVNGWQNKLKNVTLEDSYHRLTKINTRAFWYLSSLQTLKIELSDLKKIDEFAFELENPSIDTWTIDLGHHYNKDGSIFAANSLSKIGRTVRLILPGSFTPQGPRPNFKYLYENAFLPFFKENGRNYIAGEVAVNCNDCRNLWLKSYPDYLRRIPELRCYAKNTNRNLDFKDPSNFADC